jgi:polar amino acid transport system substrate-binding protein
VNQSATIEPGVLTLCCTALSCPPLFWTDADGSRHGYEAAAAAAAAAASGLELRWIYRQFSAFREALQTHECDAIWCGSAITSERREIFSYSRPYAIFDESVVVRPDTAARGPNELAGMRVAAIAGSTNMALARTFPGVKLVAFDGYSDDILGDMLDALRSGKVDAVVDDDVVFLEPDPTIRVAFTAPSRNAWGAACRKGDDALVALLDDAIARADLRAVWERCLPALPFPLDASSEIGRTTWRTGASTWPG